ncbi:type II toxin-antitoxin system VapC family toxin [bacterium]|nr:type II toxin-antitoxin system VapC family toxin [bacterium]
MTVCEDSVGHSVALWAWMDPGRIPATIRLAIEDDSNLVYFSQISTLEIQIKFGLGKLRLPDHPSRFIPEAIQSSGFNYVSLPDESFYFLDRLPDYHRDPFDRLMIAQSIVENYYLATVDKQVTRYPVLLVA